MSQCIYSLTLTSYMAVVLFVMQPALGHLEIARKPSNHYDELMMTEGGESESKTEEGKVKGTQAKTQ